MDKRRLKFAQEKAMGARVGGWVQNVQAAVVVDVANRQRVQVALSRRDDMVFPVATLAVSLSKSREVVKMAGTRRPPNGRYS